MGAGTKLTPAVTLGIGGGCTSGERGQAQAREGGSLVSASLSHSSVQKLHWDTNGMSGKGVLILNMV